MAVRAKKATKKKQKTRKKHKKKTAPKLAGVVFDLNAVEPPTAPAKQPAKGQPLASRAAFFRVPRDRKPYFIAFTAKLGPGLGPTGDNTYVPALIHSKTKADRLPRSVKDGDTVQIGFNGSQAIRFLAIDTPEKSYRAPFRVNAGGMPVFLDIGAHATEWDAYLIDAVTPGGTHNVALEESLRQRLAKRITTGVAANHAKLALAASKSLLNLVSGDIADLNGGDVNSFEIFGAMSHESFDVYGRILAFLRPEQLSVPSAQRRIDYNVRQLAEGAALPYFIWPNIDPFREATLISEAVFPPAELRARTRNSEKMKVARSSVRAARLARKPGTVFDPQEPLSLGAFELRFLADKRAPNRVAIDLAAADDEAILWPAEAYFVVPNPEDRLYIPAEYTPLFKQESAGWREPTPFELANKISAAPNVGPTGLPL